MPSRFVLLLSCLALLGCAPQPAEDVPPAEYDEAEELAQLMAYVQRYAEKLYFAGMADNAPLAQFYVHELEETFEAVEDGGYIENDWEVAELVEDLAMPALTGVEQAVAAQVLGPDPDRARTLFEERYGVLVNACNACHESTAHGFIRIVVPEASSFPNQQFAPPVD
ncbi:MAG: hypothetical protein HKN04_12800 [Rhodothermaceae bacterium]|nr:hypothetical protein [Rhodothermaceae bacterium]